jgi:pseudouridine-5'-phosphate glycosidase
LNIPATLEYLETLGVPVIGYRCDMMPAFWSQSADVRVDYRLDSAAEIADLCIQKWRAGLNGGVLIANPIPQVNQIDPAKIETAITAALALADEKSINGKALTPFLLDQIRHITGGASLHANKALVRNNALLAAEIAVEMTG